MNVSSRCCRALTGGRQKAISRGWTAFSGETALPTILSSQMLLSALKRTFCRFATTEPGTDFSHPDKSMNQMTAISATMVAIVPGRAGDDGFAASTDWYARIHYYTLQFVPEGVLFAH